MMQAWFDSVDLSESLYKALQLRPVSVAFLNTASSPRILSL
jgi:hypothetical protein